MATSGGDDMVLSDVHVDSQATPLRTAGLTAILKADGIRDDYVLCRSEYSIHFPIVQEKESEITEHLHRHTGSEKRGECSAQTEPSIDDDGDSVVMRKNTSMQHTRPMTVAIQHAMSTILDDVGLQVWPSAFLLCNYILSHQTLFMGQLVLELGCGPGLVGVVSTLVRPKTVLCTDIPSVLALCEGNIKENQNIVPADVCCMVRALDWTDDGGCFLPADVAFGWSDSDLRFFDEVDVIIASDVIYDEDLTEAFFRWLHYLLCRQPSAIALVATERRINFSRDLLSIASPAHVHFEECCQQLVNCNCDMHHDAEFRVAQLPLDFPNYCGISRSPHTSITQFSLHGCGLHN